MANQQSSSIGLTFVVVLLTMILFAGVCTVLCDSGGSQSQVSHAPRNQGDAPKQSAEGEPTESDTAQADEPPQGPRVRTTVTWPPLAAKTEKQARALAEAIVRFLPTVGMSDSEKGRFGDKYRAAMKKTPHVVLPLSAAVEVLEETPDLFKIKLLEGDDSGKVYWTPRKSIEGHTPKVQEGEAVTARVTLSRLKPNGKAWDSSDGAPDIAVCTELSDGVHCFPGDVGTNDLPGHACSDAYACEITGVRIPHNPFQIAVVDVDIAEHDTVGGGVCWLGKPCELGSATVLVQRP
jgi:hypothetical protein